MLKMSCIAGAWMEESARTHALNIIHQNIVVCIPSSSFREQSETSFQQGLDIAMEVEETGFTLHVMKIALRTIWKGSRDQGPNNVRRVYNGMVIILPGPSTTNHVEDVQTVVKRSLHATKSIDDPRRHRMFQTEGYQVHDATLFLRTCVPRPHLEQVSLLLGLVLVTFAMNNICVLLDISSNFLYLHKFHEQHLRLSMSPFAYGWPTRAQG
ncbi:hypothetical protein LRAMOSA09356 [Lichtheimia ramosa]|uniref:Uncharacterized protein n=1 Tax=Lichtheimia ramosa TaxID=688394 RepID=A0A077WGR1_9FUNG|nr:hypothetical protein LRAMOSA09356 [Lichtheimia ramosa]